MFYNVTSNKVTKIKYILKANRNYTIYKKHVGLLILMQNEKQK